MLICFCSCKNKTGAINIVWNNNQAIAILIPKLLVNEKTDSLQQLLHVRVEKSDSIPMLGDISVQEDDLLFTPIVPLTRGMIYEIYFRNKLIGKIRVPLANEMEAPVIMNVYPSTDTVPENLLKVYLQFSSPMREGESKKYIYMLDDKGDSLPGIFLDLQPELWNEEGTVLTVWLDPGRIKRDLIPNKKLGNPLQKGSNYTLFISDKWNDIKGLPLQQAFTKNIFVAEKDSLSPDPETWQIQIPPSQTDEPLEINFGEPLDFFLLQETIRIVDENKNAVKGKLRVVNEERGVQFIPEKKWVKGRYSVEIRPVLEDLAGNNLNKLFDRDLLVKKPEVDKNIFEKKFEIKQ